MEILLKRHYAAIWWIVLALVWLPAAMLAANTIAHHLGPNGLETLERTSGRWAVIWLVVTLSITPARWGLTLAARAFAWPWGKRLPDWNMLIRMRRMLGLSCFAYALLHCLIYLEFELGFDWTLFIEDVAEKPFLLVGTANLMILSLLAVTSADSMMRRLKRNWRRIHRLVYACALLAIAHWWWMSKPGDMRALPYSMALIALLIWRIPHFLGWLELPGDDGMEAPERTKHGPGRWQGNNG